MHLEERGVRQDTLYVCCSIQVQIKHDHGLLARTATFFHFSKANQILGQAIFEGL
jgi:hypothetical protein